MTPHPKGPSATCQQMSDPHPWPPAAAPSSVSVRAFFTPARADVRFLASLEDAGFPKATSTVSVHPLRQVPRSVPTALIVQGRRHPRRIENSLASFVVTHPTATFIVDPGVCVNVGVRAVAQLPAVLRAAVRPAADVVPTVSALAEQEYASADIDFALPTHAHWD